MEAQHRPKHPQPFSVDRRLIDALREKVSHQQRLIARLMDAVKRLSPDQQAALGRLLQDEQT